MTLPKSQILSTLAAAVGDVRVVGDERKPTGEILTAAAAYARARLLMSRGGIVLVQLAKGGRIKWISFLEVAQHRGWQPGHGTEWGACIWPNVRGLETNAP